MLVSILSRIIENLKNLYTTHK